MFTQQLHFLCYVHLIMHIHNSICVPPFSRITCSITSHITYLLVCCSLRNLWESEWITIIHGSQNVFLMSICSLTIQCRCFGSKYSWRIHASVGSFFKRPQWLSHICFLIYRSHVIFYILIFILYLLSPTLLCSHTFSHPPNQTYTLDWELFGIVKFEDVCFSSFFFPWTHQSWLFFFTYK